MAQPTPPLEPCVYCGSPSTTDDHIPPKAIFPRRRGALSVRSCGPCNNGASKDDEYFAIVTARRDREGKAPTGAAEVLERMLRALERPQAAGLRARIERDTALVAPRTPVGVFLPTESWTRVNVDRVERVLSRVVRGIYWLRTRERLPPDLPVRAYPWEGLTVEQARELVGYDIPKWDAGQLGDGVFAYRVTRYAPFGDHGTLWIMGFLGTLDFVVTTGEPVLPGSER